MSAATLRLNGCFELENLLTFCQIPNGKIILKESDTLNFSEGPALTLSSGQTVYGVRTVAIYLSKLSRLNLLGKSALERALVDQWLECWQTNLSSSDGPHFKETLKNLNTVLSKAVYLVSHQLTLADIMLYYAVHSVMMELTCQEKEQLVNLSRWFNQVQSNLDVRQYLPEVSFLRMTLYS